MDQSKKSKTTVEVSLKNSLNDWQAIVWQKNKTDYKFWEESWNEEYEDCCLSRTQKRDGLIKRNTTEGIT